MEAQRLEQEDLEAAEEIISLTPKNSNVEITEIHEEKDISIKQKVGDDGVVKDILSINILSLHVTICTICMIVCIYRIK